MARPKVSIKVPKRPRIDENTRFYIDYTWWEESNRSLQSYISTRLGHDIQIDETKASVDMIDPETAEVRRLSGFEFAVQAYFSQDFSEEGGSQSGSLVDGVFAAILSNGNLPMTAAEIAEKVGRPAETVYRTVGSGKIYQGIRPHLD
ncbi:MAG: hypothetical protein ACPG8W_02875 [Candidatus Promineifilaceae bacterium]